MPHEQVQVSIEPRRYIGQTPGRHAWSLLHDLRDAQDVKAKMTALSDEIKGEFSDRHVGESQRISLVNDRKELMHKWRALTGRECLHQPAG